MQHFFTSNSGSRNEEYTWEFLLTVSFWWMGWLFYCLLFWKWYLFGLCIESVIWKTWGYKCPFLLSLVSSYVVGSPIAHTTTPLVKLLTTTKCITESINMNECNIFSETGLITNFHQNRFSNIDILRTVLLKQSPSSTSEDWTLFPHG